MEEQTPTATDDRKPNEFASYDPILTAADIADELRVSCAWVSLLMRGKIPHVPPIPFLLLGTRKRVVRRSDFEAWKNANVAGRLSVTQNTPSTRKENHA